MRLTELLVRERERERERERVYAHRKGWREWSIRATVGQQEQQQRLMEVRY